MARNQPNTEQRTTSRNLRVLTHCLAFCAVPQKPAAALLALFIARRAARLAWCCNGWWIMA